jgi:hypothetical protein
MEETVLRLSQFGAMLGSRSLGGLVRSEVESRLDAHSERLVVDAEGVTAMSHGFADECFGKLANRLGSEALRASIQFRNVSASVGAVLRYAIASRR